MYPLFGNSEVSFPKDFSYVHTTFFRVFFQEEYLSKELENFLFIVWECLNIFKEAFPRQIETFQENFETFCDFDVEIYKKEIFRRQINYIHSRGASQEILTVFEIDDIFYVLEKGLLEKNLQAIKVCLTVLCSQLCPPVIFFNLNENQSQIIEAISQQENFFNENQILSNDIDEDLYYEIKKMALHFLSKVLKTKNFREVDFNSEKNQEKAKDYVKIFEKFQIEEPQSLASQLFQLKESLDLERITYILTDLTEKNIDLMKRNRFFSTVISIMERYSKGELGIDSSYLTKYCIFHNKILKFFYQNLENENTLNELIKNDSVQPLSQIIQEGILNIMQNTIDFDYNEQEERELFLKYSIGLMEKLASFYHCKDLIKETLGYGKDIIGNYLGDTESPQFLMDLEKFGQSLANFYKRIQILRKNIQLTEEKYWEEKNESHPKIRTHRFLSKKTRNFF